MVGGWLKRVAGAAGVVAAAVAGVADAYALSGVWRGSLDLGQMKLPLVFNFSENESGVTRCTMNSPSQGAKGIPTEVALCTADSISLTCNAIGASYNGRISGTLIKGTFSQRGYSFPLDLTPEDSVEERRPQTPRPPFPYTVADTTFTAPDGAVMSATLTLPPGAGGRKIPAVVMVTGSGPQNRDEELFEHKPFAVIADYLARNGIASLRYDDRGTGKSGGSFASATTFTFKDDALAGVGFLRSLDCIGKTGVLGHSEGGTIAFIAGAEGKVDFVVSLAGMAVSCKETLMRQNRHALDRAGMPEADKRNSLIFIEKYFDTVADQARKGVGENIDVEALAAGCGVQVPAEIVQSLQVTQQGRNPWIDTFLTIDARDYVANLKCPVLAVNGEKDTQVYPDNLVVVKLLAPQAETMLMPGLNHLLQHARTGEGEEYGEIRETIAPEVLEAIAGFVNRQMK